jgi:hypothetical protein
MAPTYEFTSEVPLIFSDLSYGPDVTVEHAAVAGDELPDGPVEGATVVLYPGDILTVPTEIEHAWLTIVPEVAPETPAQIKKREAAEAKAAKAAATLEVTPGEVTNVDGSPSTDVTPATAEDIAAAVATGEPILPAIIGGAAPEGVQS